MGVRLRPPERLNAAIPVQTPPQPGGLFRKNPVENDTLTRIAHRSPDRRVACEDNDGMSAPMSAVTRSGSRVVLACIVGLTFSTSPIFFSTLGLFIKPIASEFHWGRTQLASAISVAALASAFVTPFVGRLIDIRGSRQVILLSTIALATVVSSLYVLPRSYPIYLATAALIGIVGTGSTTFAYLSVLPAWFTKHFGLSLAFATMGIGLGQSLAPVYASHLIGAFGWRTAYAALGVTVLVVTVPNALLLLKDRPEAPLAVEAPRDHDLSGIFHLDALRMPAFWRLAGSFCLLTTAVTGCNVHIVPLLTDRGLTTGRAAAMAAVTGGAVLVTRFASGILLDYIDARLLGILTFSGCALGLALILAGAQGLSLILGIALLGAGLGIEGDLIAYLTRRVFGMHSYATIYGFLFVTFNIGVVAGPLIMGMAFDHFGSYKVGLEILCGMAIVAVILLLPKMKYGSWKASTPPSTLADDHRLSSRR